MKNLKSLLREVSNLTAENMLIEFERRAKNNSQHRAHHPNTPPRAHGAWRRVEAAAKLLETASGGTEVAMMGHCPSGSTFWGYKTFAGNMNSACSILEMVWSARGGEWLVKTSEHARDIASAQMRTGTY